MHGCVDNPVIMVEISKVITEEIINAMHAYKMLAEQLIEKLILETDQPAKAEIEMGNYYAIDNADIKSGREYLSDHWWFDVHGEHCLFKNLANGQTIEVYLGDKESLGNLDPYFFYNFLATTACFKHLTAYFEHAFNDTLALFEEFETQGILKHMYGVAFRMK